MPKTEKTIVTLSDQDLDTISAAGRTRAKEETKPAPANASPNGLTYDRDIGGCV
ncbi:MAG: hypothetical protein AAGH68_05310 [Pseudomonadota bacterium]